MKIREKESNSEKLHEAGKANQKACKKLFIEFGKKREKRLRTLGPSRVPKTHTKISQWKFK
jgi:hypothetical protein